MKRIFLETKRVVEFREALSVVEDMEKGQPGLMVVWGQPGRGKTECAREYAVRTEACYIRVMEDWTPRGMLSSICSNINGMEPNTKERCKKIICEELEANNLTILIDEADRLKLNLIEHLRDIHDLTGAPIVLIGEPELYATISARPRILSRVTKTVEFGPVITEDVLLLGIKAADLKIEPEAAGALAARAKGDFRTVWLDLRDMERLARANKINAITLDHVNALPARKKGPTGGRIK